jgi:hypothetical protein
MQQFANVPTSNTVLNDVLPLGDSVPIEGHEFLVKCDPPIPLIHVGAENEETHMGVEFIYYSARNYLSSSFDDLGKIESGVNIEYYGRPAVMKDDEPAISRDANGKEIVQVQTELEGNPIEQTRIGTVRAYRGRGTQWLPKGKDSIVLLTPRGGGNLPTREYKKNDGSRGTAPDWDRMRGIEPATILPFKLAQNGTLPENEAEILKRILGKMELATNAPSLQVEDGNLGTPVPEAQTQKLAANPLVLEEE